MNPDTKVKFSRNGNQLAEYTYSMIAEAFRLKRVLPTDHYWLPGMSEWRLVQELIKQIEEESAQAAKDAAEVAKQAALLAKREAAKAAQAAKRGGLVAVTTTPSVQGYRVKEYIGITRGIIVRTPNILEGFGGAIGKFMGGGSFLPLLACARRPAKRPTRLCLRMPTRWVRTRSSGCHTTPTTSWRTVLKFFATVRP